MKRSVMDAFYARTLSSDLLADALALYRNNPGLVDTRDAVARRLGAPVRKLSAELDAMVRVGLLKEERAGKWGVLFFDQAADASLSSYFAEKISKKPARRGKGR